MSGKLKRRTPFQKLLSCIMTMVMMVCNLSGTVFAQEMESPLLARGNGGISDVTLSDEKEDWKHVNFTYTDPITGNYAGTTTEPDNNYLNIKMHTGAEIKYGTYITNRFRNDQTGLLAYCVEPSKNAPADGEYQGTIIDGQEDLLDPVDGNADALRAILFYGHSAPGENDPVYGISAAMKGMELPDNCPDLEDAEYSYVHILAARAYGSKDWAKGLTQDSAVMNTLNALYEKFCSDNCISTIPDNFLIYKFYTGNSQTLVTFTYAGRVRLVKQPGTTANPGYNTVANGRWAVQWNNENYSLEGAVFQLTNEDTGITYTTQPTVENTRYVDPATGEVYTYSTYETYVYNLPIGRYTVKEITAPEKGCLLYKDTITINYDLDSSTTSYGTDIFVPWAFLDQVVYDPVDIFLYKNDKNNGIYPEGDARLDGAKFHFAFYDERNLTEEQIQSGNYTPNFYFDAYTKYLPDVDGTMRAMINLNKYSGCIDESSFWTDVTDHYGNMYKIERYFNEDDDFMFPIGTIAVTEVEPAPGYTLDDIYAYETDKTTGNKVDEMYENLFVMHINDDKGATVEQIDVLNVLTVDNQTVVCNGTVKVSKIDNQGMTTTPQGDATLQSTFEIYNKSENKVTINDETYEVDDLIATITTDRTTGIAEFTGLAYGTYLIKEVSTDDTYNLAPWEKTFSVRTENEVIDFTATNNAAANPVKRGGVSVQKFSNDFIAARPEGDATLAGAEFEIVNQSKEAVYDVNTNERYDVGEVVATITTDRNGYAFTGANVLPIGTYTITETKAPAGYKLNTIWSKKFSIRMDGQVVDYDNVVATDTNNENDNNAVGDDTIRGGVRVYKSDKDRIQTQPTGDEGLGQGDAHLAGAHFCVVNQSDNPVKVNGTEFGVGDVCLEIVTNEDGVAESASDALPYGTYRIYESESPDGYHVDTNWSATITIRNDGEIVNANGYNNNPVKEQVYRGGFKFAKIDAETDLAVPQGDATLEGAVFDVYNNSDFDVYVNGTWYTPGTVCATVTTGRDGTVTTSNDLLPYGSYYIIEKTPSVGYLLNTDFRRDFEIREDKKIVDLTDTPCGEYVIRGDVQVQKWDIELDQSEAIGGRDHGNNEFGTDLNDIVFEITNVSKSHVLVDGVLYDPNEVVKTITTHWNEEEYAYTAETTDRALPYGTYTIKEIATNDCYLLTDGSVRTFEIREDGEVVKVDKSNKDLVWKNQVIRGEFEFRKIANGSSARMNTLWVLTNVTSGEKHVIAADKNGEYYSDIENGYLHSFNTNINDKFLERIENGEIIPMSEVEVQSGLWFGLGEHGHMAEVDDTLGSLPYGKYLLSEVRTDSNTDYGLQEFEFYIYRNNKNVDIGTVTDDKIEISTTAKDGSTDAHIGMADESVNIIDTISYKGLTAGKTYKAVGTLMDKTTGEKICVADENGDMVPVTAEKTFTSSSGEGEVEVTFLFDGSSLKGHAVVVFEELFDENGLKVAEHADIDDEGQTIVYPEIKTTAVSDATGDHDAPSNGVITLIDTVSYKNLIPGRTYVLTGILMDATLGDEALDADGDEITSEIEFTPMEADGTVEVTFEFDATGLAGHKTVVFETLTLNNSKLAIHADIEDEGQTIVFPEIKTSAVFEQTGIDEGMASETTVIIDTVTYTNLLVGKTYVMNGTLMNKITGESVKDAEGNDVTASVTFVPETADGSVEIYFEFDASALAGQDVVAFESLTHNGAEVAIHMDIEDEAQTVHFPEIKTSASYSDTGAHEGLAVEETVIIDTVSYKNLKVGEEYVMNGTLMDKSTNAPVKDENGNPLTSSTTFVPEEKDGTVDVTFTFNALGYEGHTFVVFESLTHNEIEVAIHTDIEDEGQSVHFPKIGTTLTDKVTGLSEVVTSNKTVLVDTVVYENLTVGQTYVVTGMLMDKATGESLKDADGNNITSTAEFIPEETNGTVMVDFTFDSTLLKGKSVVAFESVSRDGVDVAVHADINDVAQTVKFPNITTVLHKTGADDKVLYATNFVEITDTIKYENVTVGNTYMVTGVLMRKSTGEKYENADGSFVTAKTTFTAEAENGETEIHFTFDSTTLGGDAVVAFDRLYSVMPVKVDSTDDTTDTEISNETVTNEEVSTESTDDTISDEISTEESSTEESIESSTEESTQVAVVAGAGDMVDESSETTTEEVTTEEVTTEVTEELSDDTATNVSTEETTTDISTEENATEETENEVQFTEGGLVYTLLVIDEDLDNENETITIAKPEIGTTATGSTTGTHMLELTEDAVITDVVAYKNLNPGTKYTITGTLMDKESGKAIVGENEKAITTTMEFTPETPDGTVTLEFVVDANKFVGKSIVVFEVVSLGDIVIASHEDIDDENQTVHVMDLKTMATGSDKRSKEVPIDTKAVIVDTISYTNLVVGEEYHIQGLVVDKSTGKPVKTAEGTDAAVEVVFTPTEANGEVDVTFTVNTSQMKNTTLVCFEYIYDANGILLGVHADLEDADQSVVVKTVTKVQTGVQTWAGTLSTYVMMLLAATIGVVGIVQGRRKMMVKRIKKHNK